MAVCWAIGRINIPCHCVIFHAVCLPSPCPHASHPAEEEEEGEEEVDEEEEEEEEVQCQALAQQNS